MDASEERDRIPLSSEEVGSVEPIVKKRRYFTREFECGLIELPDVSNFKLENEEEKAEKWKKNKS